MLGLAVRAERLLRAILALATQGMIESEILFRSLYEILLSMEFVANGSQKLIGLPNKKDHDHDALRRMIATPEFRARLYLAHYRLENLKAVKKLETSLDLESYSTALADAQSEADAIDVIVGEDWGNALRKSGKPFGVSIADLATSIGSTAHAVTYKSTSWHAHANKAESYLMNADRKPALQLGAQWHRPVMQNSPLIAATTFLVCLRLVNDSLKVGMRRRIDSAHDALVADLMSRNG